MKRKATVVYSVERSFVKSDISILEALDLKVYKIHSSPEKNLFKFLLNRIMEKLKSILYLSRSKFLISWFNDYHSFIPILISKLFFKKSIIIVGGYDAIVDKKNIVIKEINTGYDTRFWNYDQSEEKTGVLTAAFFSDKRVVNIKGLNIFNQLATLLPNVNFTIVGESGIRISEFINLEPNIKVMGVQTKSEMKELYQKNKFYFQGSRLEGLPNSLCEAMLCGCIPVGSRVFGIPDAIGTTGVLFDTEKDIEQMVEFINSDLGATDLKKARNRIVRKYDISKRTEKIRQNIF